MIEDKYNPSLSAQSHQERHSYSPRWLKLKNIILTVFLALNLASTPRQTHATEKSELPQSGQEQNEAEEEFKLTFITVLSYLWDHPELLEANQEYQAWLENNPEGENIAMVTIRLAKWVLEDPGFNLLHADKTRFYNYVRLADAIQNIYPVNPDDPNSILNAVMEANNNYQTVNASLGPATGDPLYTNFEKVVESLVTEYSDETQAWLDETGISTNHIQEMEILLANQFPSESSIYLIDNWSRLHNGVTLAVEPAIIDWVSGIAERAEIVALVRQVVAEASQRGKNGYFFGLNVQDPNSWVIVANELRTEQLAEAARGDTIFSVSEHLDTLIRQEADLSGKTHNYTGLVEVLNELIRAEKQNLQTVDNSTDSEAEHQLEQLSAGEVLEYLWRNQLITDSEELKAWEGGSPEKRTVLYLTLVLNRKIGDDSSFTLFGGDKEDIEDILITAEEIYRAYGHLGDTSQMIDQAIKDFTAGKFRIDFSDPTSYSSLLTILDDLITTYANDALAWYYPADLPSTEVVTSPVESAVSESSSTVVDEAVSAPVAVEPSSPPVVAAEAQPTLNGEPIYTLETIANYQFFFDAIGEQGVTINIKCSSVQELATAAWGLWGTAEQQALLYSIPATHDQSAALLTPEAWETQRQFREAYNQERQRRDPSVFEVLVLVDADRLDSNYASLTVTGETSLNQSVPAIEGLTFEAIGSLTLQRLAELGFTNVPTRMEVKIIPVAGLNQYTRKDISINPQVQIPIIQLQNTATGEVTTLYWPPSADAVILDQEPFGFSGSSKIFVQDGSQSRGSGGSALEVMTNYGWLHEEEHLLGLIDKYRYFLTYSGFYLDGNGESVPLGTLLDSWQKWGISAAYFEAASIMHGLNSPSLTTFDGLQISLHRLMGMQSTMVDGLYPYARGSQVPLSIQITNDDGADITPDNMVSFGQVVRAVDWEVFGEESMEVAEAAGGATLVQPNFTPTPDKPVPPTQMFGAEITLPDGQSLMLPIPAVQSYISAFQDPEAAKEGRQNLVNITIGLEPNITVNLENLAEQHFPQPLIIDTYFMTQSELDAIMSKQTEGNLVVVATAPIGVDSRLLPSGQVFMVWLVTPEAALYPVNTDQGTQHREVQPVRVIQSSPVEMLYPREYWQSMPEVE